MKASSLFPLQLLTLGINVINEPMTTTTIEFKEPKMAAIVAAIMHELARAEKKHPNFADGIIDKCAVVCEEAGELIRAALLHKYEGGSINEVETEAIQTACTAIRLLKNL